MWSTDSDGGATPVEQAFRDEWGRVVAALVSLLGDVDLAEEAAQEAFTVATEKWARYGAPANPRAWLVTTARNRAIDRIRRDQTLARKLETLPVIGAGDEMTMSDSESSVPDERLRLIFMCCHPALAVEAQVALTLRVVCGLSTREIADAFLVEEPTMKRRLSRAKRKIRDAGIPFRIPDADLLQERVAAVLAVVYLVFNEGYGGNTELAAEALWLGRALTELIPAEPEVHGLNALMLLDDARREARFEDGEVVLLADQDRARWDSAQIERGRVVLDRALALGGPGPYVIQAAIAFLHTEPRRDWAQIAGLYAELAAVTGSPVVELNRAIAVAEATDAEAGLSLVDRLDLVGYQYFHSTRAEFLRRLHRNQEAREEYERALRLARAGPERRFLQRRMAQTGDT